MTRTLLVAPTGHGVGLTATCLGLVHALEQQGVDVGFYKPLAQPRARRRRRGPVHGAGPAHVHAAPAGADRRRPGASRRSARNALDPLMEDVVAAARAGGAPSTTSWSSRASSRARAWSTPAGPTWRWPRRWTPTSCSSARRDRRGPRAPGRDDGDRRAHLPGRRARPGGRRGRQPAPGPDAPSGPPRSGRSLARRDLALVGAVPVPPGAGLAAGARHRRAASTSGCSTTGEQDRRVKDVIVAAQAVPGHAAAAARGAAASSCPATGTRSSFSACLAAMNGTRLAGLLLTVGRGARPAGRGSCAAAPRPPGCRPADRANSYETATARARHRPRGAGRRRASGPGW